MALTNLAVHNSNDPGQRPRPSGIAFRIIGLRRAYTRPESNVRPQTRRAPQVGKHRSPPYIATAVSGTGAYGWQHSIERLPRFWFPFALASRGSHHHPAALKCPAQLLPDGSRRWSRRPLARAIPLQSSRVVLPD